MRAKPESFGSVVKRLNPDLYRDYDHRMVSPSTVINQVELSPAGLIAAGFELDKPSKQELKSEKQFQEQVASLLRMHGIVFQRSRMDCKTTGTIGIPDFLFAIRCPGQQWGRPCAFECKMPGKELNVEQANCIAGMTDDGWDVRIVRSVDEVLAALNEWGAKELS